MSISTDPNQPVGIKLVQGESLHVEWADGQVSVYSLPFLRSRCPCAGCNAERDKREKAGPFNVLGPAPTSTPDKLEQAGNYGIAITWSDQHYSIYSWSSLREASNAAPAAPPPDADDA
jgi:DUF971 family protein